MYAKTFFKIRGSLIKCSEKSVNVLFLVVKGFVAGSKTRNQS